MNDDSRPDAEPPALRPDPAEWWRTAVVYQLYPRSFQDSDGDGIGDLGGIVARLPYLADLGVDAVWLSPFYPSPLADGGYDIADHQDVDPRLGTLATFDWLVGTAHGLGIKVIVDLVPNHTSDQHPWFVAALASPPGSAERTRYIFRDGTGPDGTEPPADWRSHFGGSAWERLPDGQWYCHLFAREQPDLNWDHPEVQQYFLDTIRFWADRGVDGFRVDVAHSLAKDLADPLRSQPNLDAQLPQDGTDPLYDRDEVHAVYRTWRAVFDSYDPPRMAVAETWWPVNDRTYHYARPDELGQAFDFSLLKSGWDRDQFRQVVERSLAGLAAVSGGTTWVLSSHDVPRHASRLGLPPGTDLDDWLRSDGTQPVVDAAVGLARARATTLMMLALPGSAYLYQGEELGLPEVADLPVEVLVDPVWFRTGGRQKGRDGCRVPLPWSAEGPSFGFSRAPGWLPQPPVFGELAMHAQAGVEGSTLEFYRQALRLRRRLPELASSSFAWSAAPDGVLAFTRGGGFTCVVNLGSELVDLELFAGDVLVASGPDVGSKLPPDHAVWLAVGAHEQVV